MTCVPAKASVNVDPTIVSVKDCVLVTPPPEAVIVSLVTLLRVPAVTFSAKVLVPLPGEAILVGAKVPVTPFGSPVTLSATGDLNPPETAVVKVMVVEFPAVTDELDALSVSVKVGIAMVSVRVAVRVSPPPVPLMVIVDVPAAALDAAVMVMVTGDVPVAVVDENFTVTPEGIPLAERVTAELKPPSSETETVDAVDPPGATVALDTFVASAKFIWLLLLQELTNALTSTDPRPVP